jgi:hypothetical protein
VSCNNQFSWLLQKRLKQIYISVVEIRNHGVKITNSMRSEALKIGFSSNVALTR